MYCIGTIKVKVWLFRDTGSIHYPSPKFISLCSSSGNKPELGAMGTAYIPHNHTLTVYCCASLCSLVNSVYNAGQGAVSKRILRQIAIISPIP